MKKRRGWKRFCIVMVCLIVFGSIPGYALNGGDAEGAKIGYSPEVAEAAKANYEDALDIKLLQDPDEVKDDWADHCYYISDAAGLVLLSQLINEKTRFQTIRICLRNNIDMKGRNDFAAIGKADVNYIFQGIFDGCGYKIDNLVMEKSSGTSYLSVFGVVGSSAKIKNLVIGENCSFKYGGNSQYSYTAALASKVTEGAMIENILSVATVSGGYYSGGLIAIIQRDKNLEQVELLNCSNAGNIDGKYAVGGLVGFCGGTLQIQNSRNTGHINALSELAFVGGIIGRVEWITDALNVNDLSESMRKVTISFENVINCGNISSALIAGGVIGLAKIVGIDGEKWTTVKMTGVCNEGSVSATSENGKSHTFIGDADGTVDFTGCTDRSDEVRLHGSQVRLEEGNQTFGVRFIGSISSLEYQEIGFYVTIKWGDRTVEKTFKCDVAFSSIETAGKDGVIYTAESLRGSDSAFLYAATVSEIPMDAGTVEFHIAPYGIRSGGTETEVGEECTVIYRNGEFVPTWERAAA